MNQIYRVVFNSITGTWQAVSEIARGRSKSSRASKRTRSSAVPALHAGMLALSLAFGSTFAHAACTPGNPADGAAVNCTGTSLDVALNANSLEVTVGIGALLTRNDITFPTLAITGTNNTFINNGNIDLGYYGPPPVRMTAVKITSPTASSLTITNNSGTGNNGQIVGYSGFLGIGMTNLTGAALDINNGSGGRTNINNYGRILSTLLSGATETESDLPVVGVYGGSQVTFTNTGTITGRVAFEGSGEGNIFINQGTITGGVSLGQGRGNNEFRAVTGSSVVSGGGSGAAQSINGLQFAAAGIVDGGAGGDNTLYLQNTLNGGTGTSTGVGNINLSSYTNFGYLNLLGGTWTVQGALVGGIQAVLQGGTLQTDNSGFIGNGLIGGYGGTIASSAATMNFANNFYLGYSYDIAAGGLTFSSDTTAFTLSGTIDGEINSPLVKTGASSLRLNGVNTYIGGTTLSGGSLIIGSNQALGTGTVSAATGTRIDSAATSALSNTFNLAGTVNFGGTSSLTLSGLVQGSGALLNKDGSGTLVLTRSNTYSGGTTLTAGTLAIGSNQALGSGSVAAANGTRINSAATSILNNSILMTGTVNFGGSSTLTLNGTLQGASAVLNKDGSGTLVLTGANTYSGGTTLSAGTLTLGSNSAIGSGNLTVTGASTLTSNQFVTFLKDVALNSTLTVGGNNDLRLLGNITGSSSNKLIKTGNGNLILGGNNSFSGGIELNAGSVTMLNSGVLGNGGLTVTGNSSLVVEMQQTNLQPVAINSGATLQLVANQAYALQSVLSGSGTLVKDGTADLALMAISPNSFSGLFDVVKGQLVSSIPGSLGTNPSLNIGSNGTVSLAGSETIDALSGTGSLVIGSGGTLNVGSLNSSSTFGGAISGDGTLQKIGTGNLTLTGTSVIGGVTSVSAGRLDIASGANLTSSQVTVANNATLGGSGSLSGSVTVNSGGTLTPGSSNGTGSLTVGSLTMDQGSTLAVALDTPGVNYQTLGQGTSVSVTGNLALNGVSLSVTDAGGFGPGLYRLFDYGGTLTMSNGGFAATPADVTIQSLTADKKINLINTQGLTLGFWNANGQASSTAMGGGSGTWSNTAAAWTDATGSITAAMSPQPGFAIFGGASGTVTLDSTAGAVKATGLQFASDGYRLNGDALTLVADAGHADPVEVRVGDGSGPSSTWTATIDNVLAGTDGLKKTGAGTLVLNSSNTYSGGTTVAAGTLSVSSDNNLGNTSGALTLDGGNVQVTGTAFSGNGSRNWVLGSTGGGIDIADAAHSFTLSSTLTGTGSLLKTGAGTLTLNGTNNYSGTTTIDGGKLVASVTNLGSGAITNNAALELNQASDDTLTQTISGNGSFTKTGAGTLTLTGTNTATGETIISAGGLVASVANLASGAITNNAALELKQASDATLAQKISGSGSLTKTGAGVLTLTGNSSNYTGSTLVANGGLLLGSTAKLGGTVTVASGATLAGTGNVGSTGSVVTVQSGATIAAGDASSAYGTLRVAGDLVLEQGALYQVQADPNSSASSLLKVAGKATLAGSVLHVGNESNAATDFQVGKTYAILQASQIEGTFGSAISNFAYLDTSLGYSANEVTLQLQRKSSGGGNGGTGGNGGGQMEFADLAETRNQSSAANAISSLPSSHALYQFVEKLPAGTPAAVLASLSGEVQASVGSSLVGLGAFAPGISGQHLRNNMTAGFRAGAPVAQSDGALPASAWPSSKALPAWAEVVGHWQRYDGDGNAAQLKQRTTGLFLGMDQEVGTSGWRLGGSVGYTNADGRVADRSSESDVNSYSAAVYGGKSFGTGTGPRINVLGGLAYTWHDIETTRRVSSLGQTLKADYSAHTAQLFAEVGYAIGQYDKVGFEPFAGVSLGQQRTGSFQEHGGFAALKGRSSTDDLASTTLGMRVHSDFQLAGKEGRLRATVGWRHAFGDVTGKKTMAFEGSQNFTVAGTPLARNTAVLGLEADVALSRSAALVLGYQGEMGSGQRDHSASVKLRWAF
ncbi:autotransporter domain-containing protein [Comamonas sp. 17RB]|uniref:autotransporter domain-containing protein n=1 Tax=Comamonas sp. 17RB TaxID=3047025 RepID=UPI0024B82D7B|nr:autotransporter domain-containing protein [Comamonas sp. 17RB]MDI9853654.1 autotransporter domain-containing protein [Comamonas sp. 17RB]